jgi:hypothetical protein
MYASMLTQWVCAGIEISIRGRMSVVTKRNKRTVYCKDSGIAALVVEQSLSEQQKPQTHARWLCYLERRLNDQLAF